MSVPEQRDSPPTTGTSHSEEEEPTEEQLKLLPSKERRQIRNKISARNFRNRRKGTCQRSFNIMRKTALVICLFIEYIGSLEAKVTQYQAENSQLQLEVKWVRNMMEKLQAENDKLRLQLMMCKEGIQQPLSSDSVQPIADSNNSLSMNSWDPSRLNEFSTPQMTSYLSHAAIPDWDFSSIIPKTTTANQNQIDLLRTYPLLGPALMSIVLHHTFNMTTEELLTTSRITSILPGYHSPMTNTKDTRLQNDLLAKLLLTNPTQSNMQEEDQGENTEEKVGPQVVQYTFEDPPVTGFLAHCPIYWLQRRFCKFIISYVVVHYPQLESPCRTYLPICQRFRKRLTPA
jgi:hypothetical protein